MKHNYKQEYKNVFIRQLREDDLEYLRFWRNNTENTKYLRKIPYITTEMQKKWFQSYLMDEDEMVFAIDEIEEINCIVGSMALYNFTYEDAEFGKFLIGDSSAHGKSIGVNALEALKVVAKEMLYLQRLNLHVFTRNLSAIKVYKKVGFEIIDKHITDNGLEEYTMSIQLKES